MSEVESVDTSAETEPSPGPDYERYLTEEERAQLVEKIQASSLADCAKASNASELALAKAAAGIKCQRGTIALARAFATA